MKKLISAAVICISSLSAQAEFIDGNHLMKVMTSGAAEDKAFSLGYVAGVFDLAAGVHHCAPSNVTIRQVSDMTLETLRQIPSMRDKSADQFVIAAVKLAWPCTSKSKSRTDI
jgi:hypothetical protein